MKQGRTIQDLAVELQRQLATKKDYVADTRSVEMLSNAQGTLSIEGIGTFDPTEFCHEQLGSRLGIPRQYYDKMKAMSSHLLATNVNYWLKNNPERRLIRTIDGNARAFLSDRYRPLDNYDLCETVLPTIQKLGCKIESCELTERRLYLKAVNNRLQADIEVGDAVQAGIVISNSEVGCGSVRIEPMIYRLSCKNGMISADHSLRKYHVGKMEDGGEGSYEFFRNETRQADDKAFWMKVRDIVEGSLTEVLFNQIVDKMRKAKGIAIVNDPIKAVEVLSKQHGLNEEEKSGVLKFLVQGGDLSLYGMLNAVTRQSQEVLDYDRATELERIGGDILATV